MLLRLLSFIPVPQFTQSLVASTDDFSLTRLPGRRIDMLPALSRFVILRLSIFALKPPLFQPFETSP